MAIDPKAIRALKVLGQVLSKEQREFVLIGATVPQVFVHLWQGGEFRGRPTLDVDATVEASSWEDFARIRHELFEAGFREGSTPHGLLFEEDVLIDLIPYGPGLVENGLLEWPDTGLVMNTAGFEEAFASAETREVDPGFSLRVVPIPGLVLLKIVAYQDRPNERARDPFDVVKCFEQYEEELEGSRRFDLAEVMVDGRPVQFEEAGAYLLGAEVAQLAKPRSLDAVREFLVTISDEYARPIVQILKEEGRLLNNETRGRELVRLFRVFGAGLEEGAKSS